MNEDKKMKNSHKTVQTSDEMMKYYKCPVVSTFLSASVKLRLPRLHITDEG